MEVWRKVSELIAWRKGFGGARDQLSFVPTMGCLHEGHLSLIRQAQDVAEDSIVSIFVNPRQFNQQSDLERYPREIERDLELLQAEGVTAVFTPEADDIYTKSFETKLVAPGLAAVLEGEQRPGHFEGVCAVVSILFHLVDPGVAVFGEKDFQQLRIIEKMVEDLHFPLQILRGKTVREEDGLAMSSRNLRLSDEERCSAVKISSLLFECRERYQRGNKDLVSLQKLFSDGFVSEPLAKCEYAEIVSEETLQTPDENSEKLRMLVAVNYPSARLIDNVALC